MKDFKDELKIHCKYNWISENISEKTSLRDKEQKDLTKTIEDKIPNHMTKYWSQNGIVTRDLEARTLGEWITNEISFLAGFAIWFREKEKDGEIDLSSLISDAVGEDVSASGEIDFNQERFDMLEQNHLFEVGDFIGIHNYINTGPNNWRRLPNNNKLLILEIYKELALLLWH